MILSAWLKFQSLFLHRPFECDRRKESTAARVALAFVFAAVRLLPSPVISKELDVLLAMVAALRSELDEVQLYSNCIFIRCNHLLISSLQTFGLSRLTVFRIAHSSNLMGVIDIDGNGMSTYRYTQNWNHIIQDYIILYQCQHAHRRTHTHTLHIYI